MKKQPAAVLAESWDELHPIIKVAKNTSSIIKKKHPLHVDKMLFALAKKDGIALEDLVPEEANVDKKVIIRAVKWAANEGLISIGGPKDKVILKITKKGKDAAKAIEESQKAFENMISEVITEEEAATVAAVVEKLVRATTEKYPEMVKAARNYIANMCEWYGVPTFEVDPELFDDYLIPEKFDYSFGLVPEDFAFDPKELGFEIDPEKVKRLIQLHTAIKVGKLAGAIPKDVDMEDVRLALIKHYFAELYDADPNAFEIDKDKRKALVKYFKKNVLNKKIGAAQKRKSRKEFGEEWIH